MQKKLFMKMKKLDIFFLLIIFKRLEDNKKKLLINDVPVNFQTMVGAFGDNCIVELITVKKG
jgi:hypothetical protein